MSEKEDKLKDINSQKDGIPQLSDAMESHPDFSEALDDMNNEFFKKENPGYYALLQKHGGVEEDVEELDDDADESPA